MYPTSNKKLPAFTLIEMLVVMTIFIAIMGIGIWAFSGMRTTILTNQAVEDFKQNLRWAQRSAVLLKRDPGESWLYGIGIDLSRFYTDEQYTIFKWCSNVPEYGNPAPNGSHYTTSKIPAYKEGDTLSQSGRLPFENGAPRYLDTSTDCNFTNVAQSLPSSGALVPIKDQGSGVVSPITRIEKPLRVGYAKPEAGFAVKKPRFILFESVTGNVFFYDDQGMLFNYQANGTPNLDGEVINFVITDPAGKRGVEITVREETGRATVSSVSADQIRSRFEFTPPLGQDDDPPQQGDPGDNDGGVPMPPVPPAPGDGGPNDPGGVPQPGGGDDKGGGNNGGGITL